MRQFRLVLEYDGTDLSGWQRQTNAPTVQQHLEEALTTLLQHPVTTAGASRTDAGVHARGQVASFRTARPIPAHGVRRGLNSLLPRTIAVRAADEVPDDFHPRHSATGKHYRYLIHRAPDRSPRWRERAWHFGLPLTLEGLQAGARVLLGEHDFAAFRSVHCTAQSTIRRIDTIDIAPLAHDPDVVAVDVRGNAFLRNMVRIVVGTLTDVGRGYRTPAQLADILASRDRTRAGMTAPAHGLELMEVRYDGRRPPRAVPPGSPSGPEV